MDKMITKAYSIKVGETFVAKWEDEFKKVTLEGIMDTKYESDNCLDDDDPEYKEFYACAMRISKVINKEGTFDKKEGDLVEISIENLPTQLINNNGEILWDLSTDGI